jgi:hypothetical protein
MLKMNDQSNFRAPLPKLTNDPSMIPCLPSHTLFADCSPFTDLIYVPKVA